MDEKDRMDDTSHHHHGEGEPECTNDHHHHHGEGEPECTNDHHHHHGEGEPECTNDHCEPPHGEPLHGEPPHGEPPHGKPHRDEKPPHGPKKRRRGWFYVKLVIFLALIVAILALVLMLVNPKGSLGSMLPAFAQSEQSAPEATAQPSAQSTPAPAESTEPVIPANTVYVSEDSFTLDGKTFDADALKDEILSQYADGQTWTLIDSHALKAAYDEAKAIFVELKIPIVEKSE